MGELTANNVDELRYIVQVKTLTRHW